MLSPAILKSDINHGELRYSIYLALLKSELKMKGNVSCVLETSLPKTICSNENERGRDTIFTGFEIPEPYAGRGDAEND
jgi:hypothetical protein